MPAEQITSGAWSTRWGDWVIGLREREHVWHATVWRWTRGGGLEERRQLDARDGFPNPPSAVAWACDVLRGSGVKILVVDRPSMTLERMLRFSPAPKGVT